MAITINGSGTITGISQGGLPDDCVDNDTLANSSVTVNGTSIALGGSDTISAGKVLQVVSTNYDTVYTANPTSWSDVSGFSASITPSSTSNKILVIVHVVLGSEQWGGIRVVESTDSDRVVGAGDSANLGSRQDGGLFNAVNIYNHLNSEATSIQSAHVLDSPASTSTVTYQLQSVGRWGSTTYYTSINRPYSWNNDSISGRITSSNITLMEIGA